MPPRSKPYIAHPQRKSVFVGLWISPDHQRRFRLEAKRRRLWLWQLAEEAIDNVTKKRRK